MSLNFNITMWHLITNNQVIGCIKVKYGSVYTKNGNGRFVSPKHNPVTFVF